jgi:hypothetical protein
MRGCAWLTGIDRHDLHDPCTRRQGLLAKKVEPSRSRRLYLTYFGLGFDVITVVCEIKGLRFFFLYYVFF